MTNEEAIYILRNTAFLASSLEPIDEAIDMACEALENSDKLAEDLQNCLEMYKKRKAEVKALKQNQWIPCSERLPKIREQCLLTVHEIGWNGTEYNRVIIGEYLDNYKNHILAWMPLPEPYKEDEE